MTTLITQTTGGSTRRCTATCYSAQRPRCRCICGSRNHGVGLTQAQENTAQMAEALLERAKTEGSTIAIARELVPA